MIIQKIGSAVSTLRQGRDCCRLVGAVNQVIRFNPVQANGSVALVAPSNSVIRILRLDQCAGQFMVCFAIGLAWKR